MSVIVFHGVPQGHDVFGDVIDKYYESFYGINDSYKGANIVFVVEVRRDSSGLCSYYSYIRPQNIVAYSGRSGSYFGMSLKVDGRYCTDVYSLYQLFDKIYEEKVLGTIIKQEGNIEQYSIASFTDADHQLVAISQLTENQLTANFGGDFETIDSSFTKQYASTSIYYNIDDVNSESFFNATRIYGKVFISPEYTAKDTIISTLSSSEKRNQALISEYEKQIVELQKENARIPDLKAQLSTLQAQFDTLTKQCRDIQADANLHKQSNTYLNQQLRNAQQELERINKTSNVVQVTERLEQPLVELLGIMRGARSSLAPQDINRAGVNVEYTDYQQSSHRHHRFIKNDLWKYISIVLMSLLTIMLLIWLVRGNKGNRTLRNEGTAIEEKFENLPYGNSIINDEVATVQTQQDSFFNVIYRNEKYINASFEISDDLNRLVSTPLHTGMTYFVTCTGIDENGEWRADGFTILDEKNKNPVRVRAGMANKAILSFYINNVDRAISVEYQIR